MVASGIKNQYQIFFELNGIYAPEEGIIFEETLFKKVKKWIKNDTISHVFFRLTSDITPSIKVTDHYREKIGNILMMYAVVVGDHIPIPSQTSIRQISSEEELGKPRSFAEVSISSILTDEEKKEHLEFLKLTMKLYQKYEDVFSVKSLKYLKNAIIYYYRAMEDLSQFRLDEGLIDLMISLESLLGSSGSELSYRLSIRTSWLLSLKSSKSRSTIFNDMKKLYRKRSKLVHGSSNISLTYEELNTFRKYLQSLILLFLSIKKSKNHIIELLDNSIIDDENSKLKLKKLLEHSSLY